MCILRIPYGLEGYISLENSKTVLESLLWLNILPLYEKVSGNIAAVLDVHFIEES